MLKKIRSAIVKALLNISLKLDPVAMADWAGATADTILNEHDIYIELPQQLQSETQSCKCPQCTYLHGVEQEWIDRHIIN